MNSQDFDKCRQFLEKHLSENIDNKNLFAIYQRLIELKSQYDLETDKVVIEKQLREADLNTQYHTAVHTNNTEYNKTVHKNNTDFGIAANNNGAASHQHYQTQHYGAVNNALNQGWLPGQLNSGI
jgi:hypothetical protein